MTTVKLENIGIDFVCRFCGHISSIELYKIEKVGQIGCNVCKHGICRIIELCDEKVSDI